MSSQGRLGGTRPVSSRQGVTRHGRLVSATCGKSRHVPVGLGRLGTTGPGIARLVSAARGRTRLGRHGAVWLVASWLGVAGQVRQGMAGRARLVTAWLGLVTGESPAAMHRTRLRRPTPQPRSPLRTPRTSAPKSPQPEPQTKSPLRRHMASHQQTSPSRTTMVLGMREDSRRGPAQP